MLFCLQAALIYIHVYTPRCDHSEFLENETIKHFSNCLHFNFESQKNKYRERAKRHEIARSWFDSLEMELIGKWKTAEIRNAPNFQLTFVSIRSANTPRSIWSRF